MACECFNRVKELVRKETGDPRASFNAIFVLNKKGKLVWKPGIEVFYHKKKKDGTFSKNLSKMDLSYGYCPFCGKKLEEDDNR